MTTKVDDSQGPPSVRAVEKNAHSRRLSSWRWVMLAILCLDICVSYIPYYTFVPILRQSMQVYGADETALDWLCIVYALVFVPGAFLTGPVVGKIGCRWTFILSMALNVVGCVVRCGPQFMTSFLLVPATLLHPFREGSSFPWIDHTSAPGEHGGVPASSPEPAVMPYAWLLIGQALCAMGQPLLVNTTSEMGAEWFPPHERPTAAMVSNLMNFVGSSLSFMLPPLLVEDHPESLEAAEREMTHLMQFQLGIAFVSMVITAVLYQDPPVRSAACLERPDVPFHQELLAMLSLRDFWVVNGQFAVYVALGHAFDAVEGTLLEHYGYSASVASWTALACAITSIGSTLLEAKYVNSPTMYKCALIVANGCLVVSLLIGFLSLHFRMDERWFIVALGVFGLATPGWGCSCELGAEVCYPAREATVSSFMEAFANLLGVFGIMLTQSLIDAGYGANVLLLMASSACAAAAMLFGLSGRLWRSEAEAEEEAHAGQDSPMAARSPRSVMCDVSKQRRISPRCQQIVAFASRKAGFALPEPLKRITGGRAVFITVSSMIICSLPLLQFSHIVYQPDLHEFTRVEDPGLAVSSALPAVGPVDLSAQGSNSTPVHGGTGTVLANGFPEPVNIVIHCTQDSKKLERFTKYMKEANLSFQVFECFTGGAREVADAVHDHLLPPSARLAVDGVTRAGLARKTLMGKAISHLRLMKKIISTSGWKTVNVFEDTEVVQNDFRKKRNALLAKLPRSTDFVNLNTLRPAGDRAFSHKLVRNKSWMAKHVFRMKQGLSPFTNGWLGNYVVTKRGVKRMMSQGATYDTFGKWQVFEQHVFAQYYEAPRMAGFVGFSVSAGVLSVRCEMRHGRFPKLSAHMCKLH